MLKSIIMPVLAMFLISFFTFKPTGEFEENNKTKDKLLISFVHYTNALSVTIPLLAVLLCFNYGMTYSLRNVFLVMTPSLVVTHLAFLGLSLIKGRSGFREYIDLAVSKPDGSRLLSPSAYVSIIFILGFVSILALIFF